MLWLVFGGNLDFSGQTVIVEPRDSLRQRVHLAPLGLWLTLDSGRFERVALDQVTNQVEIALTAGDAYTSGARLRIEQPAKIAGVGSVAPVEKFAQERGAFVVPPGSKSAVIRLNAGAK